MFQFDYLFWVVASGTMVLGFVAGIIGSSLVFEQQSQVADALSHAVFPGVMLSFMVFQKRQGGLLLLGALLMGWLVYKLILWIHKSKFFAYESILALVLSSFFSLGLFLYKVIQKYPQFQTVNHAGLNKYIFGQAAFMTYQDTIQVIVGSIVCLGIFLLFFKPIKAYLFDKDFLLSVAYPVKALQSLLLVLNLILIILGLQSVGAILISSLLVAPTIAAKQWTKSYKSLLLIAGIFGSISAGLGTYISTYVMNVSTGSTIVVILSLITFLSVLFAPQGVIPEKLAQRKEIKS